MKKIIISNLDYYVVKDERINKLLIQLKNSGRKTFLLTNSDYQYTHVYIFENIFYGKRIF